MEQDQRLTPLPRSVELQSAQGEYPTSYAGYYDDEIAAKRSVKQYLNVVKKRLPIIVAIVLLATIAAAIYTFRQPSIYQASTEMIIEPRKPQVTQKDAININFGDQRNYTNTQLQLLQNPDLMKKVVIALNLHHDPNLFGDQNRGILAAVRSMFSSDAEESRTANTLPVVNEIATPDREKIPLTPEEAARVERYAAILGGGSLKVEPLQDTNLVTVTVQTTIPALAPKVSDKLVEIFIEDNAKRELEGAQASYDQLTQSIEDLKVAIAEQENKLTEYMRSSNLPLQEEGSKLAASRLETLSVQWLTAADERRKIEARYNGAVAASARGEGRNIPDLYENKVYQDTVRLNTERKAKLQDQIRDIEKQIKDAETERSELLVKYTPEYFKVKQLQERIGTLQNLRAQTESEVTAIIERDQKRIEKEAVSGALVSLRSQLDAAVRRENQLLNSYEQEAARANVQGQAETTLTTLKRTLEANRGLLDTYSARQKEQELALSADRPNNIKISNRAVTPGGPVGPQRARNIFIAFLMSLAAGIGLAFLLDYLDDSVKTSEDVSRHLGLPTLALIPYHEASDKRALSLVTRKDGNGNGGPPTALVTLDERNSPTAEAYRHLRTSLLFSSAGRPPQSILVTSAEPSEGKTTTAINTAITLAQSGVDVVLIDCDLRRPRLHNHFGLSNTHGLTNYLSGEKSEENLIKPLPELPRLKIITSGPIPPNPAELLSSDEMRNLVHFLRGRFKHIVVDSPPAISFTDAAILSTAVDGVVLVAKAGKSSLHLMRQFRTRLSTIGARVYGVVLNGVKSGSMDYDYYGSAYYEYYRKGDDDSTPLMEEVETQSTDLRR
jgi:polysaccharide biosynthesis transport protein